VRRSRRLSQLFYAAISAQIATFQSHLRRHLIIFMPALICALCDAKSFTFQS
jgi:hypothetical protein